MSGYGIQITDGDILHWKRLPLLNALGAVVCETNELLYPEKHTLTHKVYKEAGAPLFEELRRVRESGTEISPGTAIWTDAYAFGEGQTRLRALIHVVGGGDRTDLPRYRRVRLLEECCRNALDCARDHGLHSVAFPHLHIGGAPGGYIENEEAVVALRAVLGWLRENRAWNMSVVFCCEQERRKKRYSRHLWELEDAHVREDSVALVLGGGGTRGAFQMGAWQALAEQGFDRCFTGFSGTSIGAINTLLFLSPISIEEKCGFWRNFKQADMADIRKRELLRNIHTMAGKARDEGSLDGKDIFSTVFYVNPVGRKYIEWSHTEETVETILDMSAAHPLLTRPVLCTHGGVVSIDGGTGDKLSQFHVIHEKENTNVPIQPLYDMGYRNFLVLYLRHTPNIAKMRPQELSRYGDAKIFRVFPEQSLGSIRLISEKLSEDRMKAGYEAMNTLLYQSPELMALLKKQLPRPQA